MKHSCAYAVPVVPNTTAAVTAASFTGHFLMITLPISGMAPERFPETVGLNRGSRGAQRQDQDRRVVSPRRSVARLVMVSQRWWFGRRCHQGFLVHPGGRATRGGAGACDRLARARRG